MYFAHYILSLYPPQPEASTLIAIPILHISYKRNIVQYVDFMIGFFYLV